MEANFGLQMNITVGSKECMFIPVLMISGQASDIWAEYSLYRDLKKKKRIGNKFILHVSTLSSR